MSVQFRSLFRKSLASSCWNACLVGRSRSFSTRIPASLKRDVQSYTSDREEFEKKNVSLDTRLTPRRVLLVGRPNVGKSTLFNAISSFTLTNNEDIARYNRPALVSNVPGTTRDHHTAYVMFGGLSLELIDTGGIVPWLQESKRRSLLKTVATRVVGTVSSADAVIFVIDGSSGICEEDCMISNVIREKLAETVETENKTPSLPSVIVVINKADKKASILYNTIQDCYSLNWGHPVVVSAEKYTGLEHLHRRLAQNLKKLYPLHEELDSIEKEAVKSVWQTPEDDKSFCASHKTESTDQALASVRRRLMVYERHLLKDLGEDARRENEWNEHHMGSEEDAKTADWSTELSECSFESEKSNRDLSGKSATEAYETACENETHDWMLKNDLQRTRELYDMSCPNVSDKMCYQEQLSEDTLALYAFIDSTMRPIPPPQSVRLARWLKHKSSVLNVNTVEMCQSLQAHTQEQRSTDYIGDAARLEFETAERFLQLEAEMRRNTKHHTQPFPLSQTYYADEQLALPYDEPKSWSTASYSETDVEALLNNSTCALPWAEETADTAPTDCNYETNSYETLLPSSPFFDDYLPINARPKHLAKNADRREGVMRLRREAMKADILHIALVGAPNSGKSSLLNTLTQTESAITSGVAGTTTDGIELQTRFKEKDVRLIDTAGIGSRWRSELDDFARRVNVQVIQAIRNSEIAVITVDATKTSRNTTPSGAFIRQELDLLGLVTKEYGKIAILAINKWDLVPCDERMAQTEFIDASGSLFRLLRTMAHASAHRPTESVAPGVYS